MIRILREGAGTVQSLKECILQPQSEIEQVRAFLLEEGFSFIREDMVEEDGKYYPMMSVPAAVSRPLPEGGGAEQTRMDGCGAALWEITAGRAPSGAQGISGKRTPDKKRYYTLDRVFGSDRACRRAAELKKECKCAEKGLIYYALQ